MKPPESKMAELAPNATGGKKSRAEAAESAEFKMTELGPIPQDWEVKRLGEVCLITTGHKDVNKGCKNGKYPFFTCSRNVFASNSYSFNCEAILVAGNGDVGNLHYYKGKFEAYQRTYVLNEFSEDVIYILHELTYNLMSCLSEGKIGSSIPYITIQQLDGFMLPIPPLAEQRRIAEALSDVDELISALGELIEKKRNIKTGAMQELLGMRNGECGMRNVPRRRLAGFSGEWVEKRFDDCFDLIGNNTYARECMCDDGDGLANIHYGDVLIRYGSVLDCTRTAVPSLIKSIICRTDRLSDGDVIIADTAEDETVGKAIEIRGLKGRRAVSGLHTIACRPRFDFAPGWLGYYINSSAFHNQLLPLITGTKVSSISKAGLRTTILNVPTLAEQQAIAAVLSDMDAEIAALEAKRAKYESIKQGMMQELLTGRTRLKGECE